MYNKTNMADYEATYHNYECNRPLHFNFARDVIDKWANRAPEQEALWFVDDSYEEIHQSYHELARSSRQLANVLSSAGIALGDTVIVIIGRQPVWWIALTATLRMGAVASPGTTQLTAKDLKYRIQASGARAVIADQPNTEKVDQIAGQCETLAARVVVGGRREGWIHLESAMEAASDQYTPAETKSEDPAFLYFTSGTTGYPKMVLHTQASYGIAHETTGRFWLDLRPGDVHWNISDTGWAKAAYSSYFGPLLCGATVFVDQCDRFDAKRILEFMMRYPITTFCSAPTVYRMLVLEDLDHVRFKSLRHCVGAGEPLNPEVIETWEAATGITIRDGYGQTETVLLCGAYPCLPRRPGSMGLPIPGIDLQIVDAKGNILQAGREGDIAVRVKPVRPVGLFREYWKEPDKTAAVFRGDWYITGDRGYRDTDGYFWFVSRADDVITSAGYRIGPFEVESALIEHPAVVESAVVSSPDDLRGAIVKAYVVLAPGSLGNAELVQSLQEHVKTVTAPYKYPRKIEFVEALPKTISGKIRRIELREREWRRSRN